MSSAGLKVPHGGLAVVWKMAARSTCVRGGGMVLELGQRPGIPAEGVTGSELEGRTARDIRRSRSERSPMLWKSCQRVPPLLLWNGEAVMARKKSLWSELQRERERRQRVARAQEHTNEQTIQQIMRDHDRAERQAARADAAERKRQVQLAHEAGASAAKAMKARLDARLAELRTLLTSALDTPPQLSFAMLKQTAAVPPFEPGGLGEALPLPVWEDFAPPPPGVLSGLMGGKARHARAQEAAQDAFELACADHALAEEARARQLLEARLAHDLRTKAIEAEVREHNAAVDELERAFRAGVPDAVEEYFGQVLALSGYPSGFPCEYQVAYRQEPRELVIEYRLPPVDVIPAGAGLQVRQDAQRDRRATPAGQGDQGSLRLGDPPGCAAHYVGVFRVTGGRRRCGYCRVQRHRVRDEPRDRAGRRTSPDQRARQQS